MKGVFLDQDTVGAVDYNCIKKKLTDCDFYTLTNSDQVLTRCQNAEVVIANKVEFTDDILSALPNLKLICVTATGTDNINLNAAKQQGVAVCNVPAYSTQSVAQHTFALMLALSSSLIEYNTVVQAGEWQKRTTFNILDFPIQELAKKTLGIVGYGDIGKQIAAIAKAFKMNVLLTNIPGRLERPNRLSLTELLPQVDFLTLHCPLTRETRKLISTAELALMRPTAFIINTSRGAVIDELALATALQQGTIAGAGLDVLSDEPPAVDHCLLNLIHPRLIITPHIAWATVEARQRCINIVADNIDSFIAEKELNRVV